MTMKRRKLRYDFFLLVHFLKGINIKGLPAQNKM